MAHYCHFWYKLGGCTCNSWVLDSRVQVTRGNKFARVGVPLLELKYSQVRVRVNSRVHSWIALIPTHIQKYFPVVYLAGFQLASLYCRQKATLPNILDILYSKFWAATKGFNSFLPPTIIAWISPWKKRTHWARRIHGQRKWDRYHNSHRGYDLYRMPPTSSRWKLYSQPKPKVDEEVDVAVATGGVTRCCCCSSSLGIWSTFYN